MNSSVLLAVLLLLSKNFHEVFAKDDQDEDDDGFFYFEDNNDWSNSAIYPHSCINTSDGDAVVYEIYKKGHNQCRKKSMGKYKMGVSSFLRAYVKQQKQDYEKRGQDYEVDEDVMGYLECQEYYYNNAMIYLKVGCRSSGTSFMLNAYSDMYCTEKSSYNYNFGIDISSLRVSFNTCKNCVATTYNGYNNYNNNNYNENNNYNYNNNDNYGYNSMSQHDSMLCSTANHYKENCNRSCRRASNKVSSSRSSGGGWTEDGFSPFGKFFLWILSLSAIFFLLAGLAQRKKMSKQDALIEEAAIKSSGVDKKYVPRIFVVIVLFMILLILLKKKVLTWFFLLTINVGLLGYWMHLKKKAEQNAAVSGFQLYGEGGTTA